MTDDGSADSGDGSGLGSPNGSGSGSKKRSDEGRGSGRTDGRRDSDKDRANRGDDANRANRGSDADAADDADRADSSHGDVSQAGSSLSDEEIASALSQFEQELSEAGAADGPSDASGKGDDFDIPDIADDPSLLGIPDTADDLLSEAGAADAGIPDADASAAGSGADSSSDAAADVTAGFDEELEGLIGNRAKAAAIITRLASAELLAAFCRMSDIDADCIDGDQGAVAVLRDLDGNAPEVAATDLTDVVNGMAVVLAVNRADRLDATLYLQGEPGQTFAPPVLFSSSASFVEDLMLGLTSVDDLRGQGASIVASDGMDQAEAMRVIARHTRFGRRGGVNG